MGIEALACVKTGGTLVTLPSVTKDEVIAAGNAAGVKVEPIRVEPNSEQLDKLAGLYVDNKAGIAVSKHLPIRKRRKSL